MSDTKKPDGKSTRDGKRIVVVPKKPAERPKDRNTKEMMERMLFIVSVDMDRIERLAKKNLMTNSDSRILTSHAKTMLDIEKAMIEREKFDKFGHLSDAELLELARQFESKDSKDKDEE